MDCPKCGHEMMNYGVENCCATCGTTSCGHEVDISRAEYDRLLAIEAEYGRLRAALEAAAKSLETVARDAGKGDLEFMGEVRAYASNRAGVARAAIARAKGEGE